MAEGVWFGLGVMAKGEGLVSKVRAYGLVQGLCLWFGLGFMFMVRFRVYGLFMVYGL